MVGTRLVLIDRGALIQNRLIVTLYILFVTIE